MNSPGTPRKKFLHGNIWTGILFLLVGGLLLLRQSGYPFPEWLFTWPTLLITIGLIIGLRNRFCDFNWLIMIIVGSVFLLDHIYPGSHLRQYAVPFVIILVGLIFIFAPRSKHFCRVGEKRDRFRKKFRDYYEYKPGPAETEGLPVRPATDNPSFRETSHPLEGSQDSSIDIVSFFSGIKKKILSKNFKGGEVVCIFGGTEINLTNADFLSPIVIDFVQIFGGTKLIVPANWEIRSEVSAIFGGIEDKRPQPVNNVPEKTVVIQGTVIFGGVEISSY
jgi:predicted membrane protein